MTTPILHREDEHRLVFEAPRMGSTILGSLAALVLLVIWAKFPNFRIAQGIFLLMTVVAFSGPLHIHRLTLDLQSRRWTYRDGWTWQAVKAEGTFDDLACVAIEENALQDGLVASKLRSRLLFLEFDEFDAGGPSAHEGRFPLGFAMGPSIAPDKAREFADRLGVAVENRTTGSTPEPGSESPETPPSA